MADWPTGPYPGLRGPGENSSPCGPPSREARTKPSAGWRVGADITAGMLLDGALEADWEEGAGEHHRP